MTKAEEEANNREQRNCFIAGLVLGPMAWAMAAVAFIVVAKLFVAAAHL